MAALSPSSVPFDLSDALGPNRETSPRPPPALRPTPSPPGSPQPEGGTSPRRRPHRAEAVRNEAAAIRIQRLHRGNSVREAHFRQQLEEMDAQEEARRSAFLAETLGLLDDHGVAAGAERQQIEEVRSTPRPASLLCGPTRMLTSAALCPLSGRLRGPAESSSTTQPL